MIPVVDSLPLMDSGLDGPAASAIGLDVMGNVLTLSVTDMFTNGLFLDAFTCTSEIVSAMRKGFWFTLPACIPFFDEENLDDFPKCKMMITSN